MRTCPFHGCEATVQDHMFACFPHWKMLSPQDKSRIGRAYDDYRKDLFGIEVLRRIQQDVLGDRGTAAQTGDPDGQEVDAGDARGRSDDLGTDLGGESG